MLTREEKEKLYNALMGNLLNLGPGNIHLILDGFTEKPQRDIQVGDIYSDGHGHLIKIKNICKEYDFPIIARPLSSEGAPCGCRSVNYSYNYQGEFLEGIKLRNLILSPVYKLVEIEE